MARTRQEAFITEPSASTWTTRVASLRALPYGARVWLLAGSAALIVVVALLVPPLHQDEAYHDFAPTGLFGVARFGIVASNGAFLIIGLWGLWRVATRKISPWPFRAPREHWAYLAFFLGVVMVALGSGYYHAGPTTETLLWDRLTMTVAFMALLAAFIGDRVHLGTGGTVVLPLLIVLGALSMVVWRVTGDLRLYFIVQALPMLLIWMICLLFPGRVTRVRYFVWMAFWFGLASFCDLFDKTVYDWIGFGGHAIKHVLAAIACATVLAMLQDSARRQSEERRP